MRSLILILGLSISITAVSQPELAVSMKSEFDVTSGTPNYVKEIESVKPSSANGAIGSQFFIPGWAPGSIWRSDSKSIEENILLIYDKVRQELFIKPRCGGDVFLANKNTIDHFIIDSDKPHDFVCNAKYGLFNDEGFCEIIINNKNGFSLLKTTRTKFIPKDFKDIDMIKNGQNLDEYKDYVTYYISYKGGFGSKIKLRAESIRKAFGEEKEKMINSILRDSHEEFNEGFLMSVVDRVNACL